VAADVVLEVKAVVGVAVKTVAQHVTALNVSAPILIAALAAIMDAYHQRYAAKYLVTWVQTSLSNPVALTFA
jgi:hypothetical protein